MPPRRTRCVTMLPATAVSARQYADAAELMPFCQRTLPPRLLSLTPARRFFAAAADALRRFLMMLYASSVSPPMMPFSPSPFSLIFEPAIADMPIFR